MNAQKESRPTARAWMPCSSSHRLGRRGRCGDGGAFLPNGRRRKILALRGEREARYAVVARTLRGSVAGSSELRASARRGTLKARA